MIALPNNCRYGEPAVHPKGWKGSSKKLLEQDWYIKYRFYDDNLKKSKVIMIRANKLGDLQQRQAFVKETLEGIKQALEVNGFNPITRTSITDFSDISTHDIDKNTLFTDALEFAYKQLKVADTTLRDIRQHLKAVKVAVKELGLAEKSIGDISLKHLRMICDKCAILKDNTFSPDKFNRHRSSLGILYTELLEFEVVPGKLPYNLKVQDKGIKKLRDVLTDEQRIAVDAFLKENYYRFWLLLHIFFHSGSRETEIVLVKVKDVDLKAQTVKYLIKKGKKYTEKLRPMKDIAVPYWQEAIAGGLPEQYVFSRLLKPGDAPIKSYQIQKRWYRLIKKPARFGITADFYALKHLNTTETAEIIGTAGAGLQNAESEAMINQVYDLKAKNRAHDKLKKVPNSFVPKTEKPS